MKKPADEKNKQMKKNQQYKNRQFEKNQQFELTVTDMSEEGTGIGKTAGACSSVSGGFTWFVKDAVPGDRILAAATKVKKNYGFARLVRVLETSPERVQPLCFAARACGGCQLQQLSAKAQLCFKENRVLSALTRIGGFRVSRETETPDAAEPGAAECRAAESNVAASGAAAESAAAILEPIIGMEEPWRYRNKAQYPVSRGRDGRILAGFYAGHTHSVIGCEDCRIGAESDGPILAAVISWMELNRIEPYDEETRRGIVRHVLIRTSRSTGEIMVCLVINSETLPKAEKLLEKLAAAELPELPAAPETSELFAPPEASELPAVPKLSAAPEAPELPAVPKAPELPKVPELSEVLLQKNSAAVKRRISTVCCCINREDTNVILGDKIVTLSGTGYITDTIGGVAFRISPHSFFQVNSVQVEKLYAKALEYAGLTGREIVWDLYCGVGTISLSMAGKAARVYGVEIVPQAVEDARENAERNGILNTEFYTGRAEEIVPAWMKETDLPGGRGGEKEALRGSFPGSDRRHPDVICVDPPRKGCDEKCLETILRAAPDRIVYVSCDPATLARDLRYLAQGGYRLKKICPVDMFPQTVHVETVCLLSKLSGAKNTIDVKVDMDELDVTSAEAKATYEEMKAYVLEQTGLQVSNLYIAQVKRECGIIERENYNKSKSENSRQPKCPEEKVEAIKNALKHFGMIG